MKEPRIQLCTIANNNIVTAGSELYAWKMQPLVLLEMCMYRYVQMNVTLLLKYLADECLLTVLCQLVKWK